MLAILLYNDISSAYESCIINYALSMLEILCLNKYKQLHSCLCYHFHAVDIFQIVLVLFNCKYSNSPDQYLTGKEDAMPQWQ